MTDTTALTIRVFTHVDAPGASAVTDQAAELAATHGLRFEVVDVEADPGSAIVAGVVGLPAVGVEVGGVEVGRRECASAGRRLGAWVGRRLAGLERAPRPVPAFT